MTTGATTDGMDLLEKVRLVARAAADKLADDIAALDVRGVVSFADALVICTGRSDRHVRSIADAVDEAVTKRGERPLGVEGYEDGRWVLMDLSDVIVHVFQEEVRSHYDLERLWSDARTLEIALPTESGAARTLSR